MAEYPSCGLDDTFRRIREYSSEVRASLDPDTQAAHDDAEARWAANLFRGEAPVPPSVSMSATTTLALDASWKQGGDTDA